MQHPIFLAFLGTGFTFLATAAGAAAVYFLGKNFSIEIHRAFLGFASGVMIAASIWSLLLPAMDIARKQGMAEWLPAVSGFLFGGIFLFLLDHLLPHIHAGSEIQEGPQSALKRTTMLVFAVTLHNIPEGIAVGLSFSVAAQPEGIATLESAAALAVGMALQNLPEGAAISLPLRKEGFSKNKAFLWGALSGAVEPIAGVIGAALALAVTRWLPFLLSFAAGAMIYVVIEELVPEAKSDTHYHTGTIGAMLGFLLMMVLDTVFA